MNVLSSDIRLHVERMQTSLKEEGIDAFIGTSSVATLYFFGQVFSGLVYIPQQGEPIYLIRRPQSFGEHQGLHYIRKIEQLSEIVDLTNISKIALETDELPYSDIERQKKMFHQAEVFNGTSLLRKIRMVKTPYEIAEIRKNCLKHIAVYEKVKQIYRAGMSDTELQIEIEHLMREISKIVSPFANLSYPFKVRVISPEFDIDQESIRTLDDFNNATISLSIDFDETKKLQQSIFYDKEKNIFNYHLIPLKSFGGIRMKIFFFDEPARRNYRKAFPNDPIDGFKVYRDGIIATPFAETNEIQDLKRDILGIDKRVYQDIFNRISTREFLGVIDITKNGNPQIIDATNRQDFVDNDEYREMKKFIITQLNALQDYKVEMRQAKRDNAQEGLKAASDDISSLVEAFNDIVTQKPELKQTVEPLIKQVRKTGRSVKTAISEQKKALEDFTRKENIYMSIMSLQQFAINITHAVRTTLNQIRDRVEFFYRYYPDPEEEELFMLYSKEMYERFKVLNRVINYMLSYSQSNLTPEEVDLKTTFEEILGEYDDVFSREGISLQTDFPDKIVLNANRQFFRDILQNLIDNSVKAMAKSKPKVIRCSYEVQNDMLEILVSDTGIGIPQEDHEQIFALYYTTTELQGGAGIGLYIVKTRVQSLGGSVAVVDSEFGEIGTTIKITIPFKK